MLTYENQELLSQLLRGALLNENGNEALASLRALSRKLKTLGIDPSTLSVFINTSIASKAAMNAINERNEARNTLNSLAGRLNKVEEILDGAKIEALVPPKHPIDIEKIIREAGPSGIRLSALINTDPNRESTITRRIRKLCQYAKIEKHKGDVLIHRTYL